MRDQDQVVARAAGLIRDGVPRARAISRALVEHRRRYRSPAAHAALVLEINQALDHAERVVQAIARLTVAPPATDHRPVPPPVVIEPPEPGLDRRAALRRAVAAVLERPTPHTPLAPLLLAFAF